ncbi:hypothetical protein TSOC_010247 [Tetrabaena socialis]|uniref:Peptidase S1 domain-containing protein n=1 Tax=Tetrabaena socialis TaxID=47790 RepID=A0A2J7ZTU4_9CHLO|nr:hypothetical protein TSOC_010247 [Tetrabaena socialis]|eukprot:PNH03668.1 hypothetical protein TSOC_010247 [Tetrabaena socialis]
MTSVGNRSSRSSPSPRSPLSVNSTAAAIKPYSSGAAAAAPIGAAAHSIRLATAKWDVCACVQGAALSAPQAALAVGPPQCVPVVAPDQALEDAFGRVSRLNDEEGRTIGTCFRVQNDVVLAARHCVVEGGRCLGGFKAFGGNLAFVAAIPELDAVAFRGPPGSGFTLLGTPLRLGMPVSLLSFPEAYDKELKLKEDAFPAMDTGVVSQVSGTGQHALATFGTGMPVSSGGAVVSDSSTLAGLYTGTVWHLEGLDGSSRSSSGGGGARPPAELERDPKGMWDDNETDEVEAAAASDTAAA